MFVSILVKFLVRERGVKGKGPLGSFRAKRLLQFLIAKVCCVLVGDAAFGECLVGYREYKLSFLCFPVDHVV